MMRYDDASARDRAEIEDLMARYLFAMDWNDFDAYADCFTEDGTLEFAQGSVTGRDAIREKAKGFKEAVASIYTDVDGNPAVLRHILCHSAIRVEGDRVLIDDEEADTYTFAQDYYFAMGDFRDNSVDSRYWGFVPHSHLIGKAVFTFLSFKGEVPFVRPTRFFRPIP